MLKRHIPVVLLSVDIFICHTILYTPVSSSSRLPVLAYFKAIITLIHYLELTKKKHTIVHIIAWERDFGFFIQSHKTY